MGLLKKKKRLREGTQTVEWDNALINEKGELESLAAYKPLQHWCERGRGGRGGGGEKGGAGGGDLTSFMKRSGVKEVANFER